MIRQVLRKNFSTFNIVNSLNGVKQAITSPLKHLQLLMAPGSARIGKYENVTASAFD
jgi:hypothetical protein